MAKAGPEPKWRQLWVTSSSGLQTTSYVQTEPTTLPLISWKTSFINFKMVSGSCACRYIRYTTTIPPDTLVNCHCVECRKQSGAPYQAWIFFPADAITWAVKPTEWRSSDTAARSFCPRCGSTMTMYLDKDLPSTGVAVGTLDDDGKTGVPRPAAHIFLKEKASWFDLPDDEAKRFQGWDE